MPFNRLLVVDDDEDLSEVMAEIGQQVGYETRRLSDPRMTRHEIAAWPPSVIITDLQMPAFDGVAFLRMLAADGCKAKIIIVSAMDHKLIEMTGDLSRQRGLEIAGTFTKPFVNAELRECLVAARQQQPIPLADIAHALQCDEIKVYLQPKCEIVTGRPVGAEALARWISPERGIVLPAAFLRQVIDAGLSDIMFDRVLTATLIAATRLRRDGLIDGAFRVAVNMTVENVLNLSLPDRVRAICEIHDWPMRNLTLELTETASMDHSHDAIDVLTRLRLMNVNLSIDDFGTGYSSLLRLRQLPFTEVKIDHAFTSRILDSRDSAVIVRTILTMAENLSLDSVAEGVETQAIAQRLQSLECAVGQGFHFSKPIPINDFADWLRGVAGKDDSAGAMAMSSIENTSTLRSTPYSRALLC